MRVDGYRWLRKIGAVVAASLCGMLLSMPTKTAHGDELNEARFEELLKELRPAEDEAWRTIPWKIALLDAKKTASQEHKPIFIWAMDGHPLGCT